MINIDESSWDVSTFSKSGWQARGASAAGHVKRITQRLTMVAALDNHGRVWYSLSQSTGNKDTFALFLEQLAACLDSEVPGWQAQATFVLDNAPLHLTEHVQQTMAKLQMSVMYTAPYSYTSSPIEQLFGRLKQGELNVASVPTGKR